MVGCPVCDGEGRILKTISFHGEGASFDACSICGERGQIKKLSTRVIAWPPR